MTNKIFIYQIYYDEESRAALDPGFIPLDNSANPRPDWYEFWPIREFLRHSVLDPDAFYGFLSPRFTGKVGYSSTFVHEVLEQRGDTVDVLLLPAAWDQIAYFLNPFEQGEIWHPGIKGMAQAFIDHIGLEVDLSRLVTHSLSSVFSNYLVARGHYWQMWLDLAERFYQAVESAEIPALNSQTSYGSEANQAPMKTFIQERLSSVILGTGRYRAISPDLSQDGPLDPRLFPDDMRTRRQLQACNLLKESYVLTGDEDYLRVYYKIRANINYLGSR